MNKLTKHQIAIINSHLDWTYDEIRSSIIDLYKVVNIDEIPSTEYENVLEQIQEWHAEINADYQS